MRRSPATIRAARRRVVASMLALACAGTAGTAAATLQPAGPEAILDEGGCGTWGPRATALPNGFAVAWGDNSDVFVRRVDANAQPVAAPLRVVENDQPTTQEILALPGGGLVVVWYSSYRQKLFARRAGADGVFGAEVEIGAAGPDLITGLGGIDLAITASGNVVVVWTTGASVLLRELLPNGTAVGSAARVIESYAGFTGVSPRLLDPVVLARADGRFLVLWVHGGQILGPYTESGEIEGYLVRPLGNGSYANEAVVITGALGTDPEAAMAADGTWYLAWVAKDDGLAPPPAPYPGPYLLGRRFTAANEATTPPVRLDGDDAIWEQLGGTSVEALPGNGFAVAFHVLPELEPLGLYHSYLRELDAGGIPVAPPQPIAPAASLGQALPALAFGPAETLLVGWQEQGNFATHSPPCEVETIRVRPFRVGCGVDGGFCVDGGRFQLSLTYSDPRRGLAGTARGVPLTDDSGYFWFFDSDNVEVVVKVLDGRATNGHYWVFYGGLTDVGFTLSVTDTATATTKRFEHAAGTLASRGITNAFPAAATAAGGTAAEPQALSHAALARDAFAGDDRPSRLPVVPAAAAASEAHATGVSPCSPPELPVPPGPGLCLEGRRFAVTAEWTDFVGNSGIGHGVPIGDDSGYFWFFDPANIELVVKVLDGRAVNGRYWVFYGALSNVEYDLAVEHVLGDQFGADGHALYHNPAGTFASVADIRALRPPIDVCPVNTPGAPVCGRDGRTYGSVCHAHRVGWVEMAHPGVCSGG